MNICHVIGLFSPEHGGPVVSCRNYALGQTRAGHEVRLYCLEGYPGLSPAVSVGGAVAQEVEPVAWPARIGRSGALRKRILAGRPADIYHLHGVWLRAMYYGYERANKDGRPYLIEVNGNLDPRELATKPWRKRLVRWWYQDRMLRKASCIHVNSAREARHVRGLGFRAPIAVIPAGFNFGEFDALARQAEGRRPTWAGALGDSRVLLYLSRIHPAKGIDDLLAVWPELERAFPEWALVIVGPGDRAAVESRKARMRAAGVSQRCHWVGMVSEIDRAWAYAHADLYVLPSHKENFGNTVQEALGYGTPVVTTRQTPWTELERWDCGWTCEDNPPSLGKALSAAMRLDAGRLAQKGQTGRRIIARDFSLENTISRQLEIYSWLLGGDEPACLWQG